MPGGDREFPVATTDHTRQPPDALDGGLDPPTFLARLKIRNREDGSWLTPCPDLHSSSGFSVLIYTDEQAGRYRLTCLEAAAGDLCGNETQLRQLLGITESELHLQTGPTAPFAGMSHDEVLVATVEGDKMLVDDLIEAGVVGDIAGVPESHKSWLAQAIAIRVATGDGQILGRSVAGTGPVGYFWQDDSRRNEIERIQTFNTVHSAPAGLQMRWYLNEGLELPRDLDRLRNTVDQHKFVLIILDSFYNVAAVDIKDTDAGDIVKQLKSEICDSTGCTVLIVDHMAWATDVNRSRLRSYGSVVKGAAARFHILIDADRDKLWIEARGNNIRGLKKTPASWNADTLELQLLDEHQVNDEEYDQRVLDYLKDNPGCTKTDVAENAGGNAPKLRKAVDRLVLTDRVTSEPTAQSGRLPHGARLNINPQARLQTDPDAGSVRSEGQMNLSQDALPTKPTPPYRGSVESGSENVKAIRADANGDLLETTMTPAEVASFHSDYFDDDPQR